jgi:tRNA pseudouridine55 synthase
VKKNEGAEQALSFCGFINVLKPPGMSSAQAVARARRLFAGAKTGHAGTLDPEAAGVLPLMVGRAARLFDSLQDGEKTYIAEIAFGCATDTQDAQGRPVATGDRFPDARALEAALAAFTGRRMQTPPMYSALKRGGRPLYDRARSGETVALESRPVTVTELALLGETPRHGALLRVRCSKGFYVRTLCHDLGRALGCPAHMRFLLRTQSGPFSLETAQTLEQLAAAAENGTLRGLLLPMETAVGHLPRLNVPETLRKPFVNGVPLRAEALSAGLPPEGEPVRLYLGGALTAIGVRSGGELRVKTWLGEE